MSRSEIRINTYFANDVSYYRADDVTAAWNQLFSIVTERDAQLATVNAQTVRYEHQLSENRRKQTENLHIQTELHKENLRMQAENLHIQTELQVANQLRTTFESELTLLRNQLAQFQDLQAQIQNLQTQMDTQRNFLRIERSETDKFKSAEGKLKIQNGNLSNENTALRKQIKVMESSNERLTRRVAELELKIEADDVVVLGRSPALFAGGGTAGSQSSPTSRVNLASNTGM